MQLLDKALIAGMDEDVFWDSTPAKVTRFIKAYNERSLLDDKHKVLLANSAVTHLATLISSILSGKSADVKTEDLYSWAYTEEEINNIKQQRSANMLRKFALSFNQRKEHKN